MAKCRLISFMLCMMLVSAAAWSGSPAGRLWAQRVGAVLVGASLSLPPSSAALTGGEVFSQSCAGCHAGGGNILAGGKSLRQKDLARFGYVDVESIYNIVDKGKGMMGAYGSFTSPKGNPMPAKYSPEEIKAVADYVLLQAASDWK